MLMEITCLKEFILSCFVADKLYLNPVGMSGIKGLSTEVTF